jgi:hypothetical protein
MDYALWFPLMSNRCSGTATEFIFYFYVCVRGVPFRQSVGDGNEVNGEPEIVDDVFDEPPPAAARGISFESPRRE